jgi:integrase/recombinase XerD
MTGLETASPQALVDKYLDWAEHDKGLRPLTIRIYRHTLDGWVEWLGDKSLADVEPEDVEAFAGRPRRGLKGRQSGTRGANATRRRDVVAIRQFHQWAAARRHLPRDGAASAIAPSVKERTPKPVNDDVWVKLWTSDLIPDDRLWLGLGYFAGLRRYEIVTMPPSAVDIAKGELRFERKGGGTKPVEYLDMCRVVNDFNPWIMQGWEAWAEQLAEVSTARRGEQFLHAWSEGVAFNDANRLNRRLERTLLKRAGLPSDILTPHALRHSCATNLLRAGVEPVVIADQLGHSNVSTTMNYMKTSGQLGRWRKGKEQ